MRHFIEEYDPTIDDELSQAVSKSINETCILDILDTAGQEEFSALRDQWMRTGQGFLMLYDITSRSSFDALPALHNQILQVKDEPKVPIVLVGNKCDLDGPARAVAVSEGAELAKGYGCPFLEASAKSKINVEESFFELVRLIRADAAAKARPAKPASKKAGCLLS